MFSLAHGTGLKLVKIRTTVQKEKDKMTCYRREDRAMRPV